LSTAHISPQGEVKKSGVTIWTGGGLIKAQRSGPYTSPQVGGGKRGKIKIMSKGSRRRLMQRIAKTRQDTKPVFITLTYPDIFSEDPRAWKRDIDCLAKRLFRKNVGGVWRIEFKKRKSGQNVGQVAPHFHLLAWGLDAIELLCMIPRAWYEIVGSEDQKHLAAGTRVEAIRSWKGVMSYTSKYISKADNDIVPDGAGRFWGVFGDKFIPWSETDEISCTDKQVIQLFRYLRRYLNQKKAWLRPSMTVFIQNPTRWKLLLETLQ
jgi:hypothetical protein